MTGAAEEADQIRVILADANVLYSRVLRDYLLYAADQEIIAVAWSAEILREVTGHQGEHCGLRRCRSRATGDRDEHCLPAGRG